MTVGQATDILWPEIPEDPQRPAKVDEQITTATQSVQDFSVEVGDLASVAAASGITLAEYTPGTALSYVTGAVGIEGFVGDADLAIDGVSFQGEVPSLPPLSDINIGSMPEPFFGKPSISVPAPPNIEFPDFDVAPPSVTNPDLPSAPSVSLPDPPTIEDVVIPAPPDAVVPEFEGTAPTIDLTAPALNFEWSESPYTSHLMTAIKARLEADVATGGQGYSVEVEQAMYDRQEAPEFEKDELLVLDALEDSGARGWMIPPGETAGKVLQISDMINKRREELNAKIINEQAALAQKNTHLAWTAAVKVEKVLLNHHSKVQQRSYEASVFTLKAAIEIYKFKVEAYKAKAQAFSVLAKVYEARIRAEIVKAELYKAHIEGLKTGVEANKLKVEVYKAQLQGIQSLVSMYRAEMEAGRVIAQIEKTRILQFSAQVEAYKARVEAIQAKYEGYVAQVRGEILKADIVKADADAAKARARAYEAQAEAELQKANAALERVRAEIIIYKAQIEKYAQTVRYNTGKARYQMLDNQETANLRVVQSRLDRARKDLRAATFNAQVTEANGAHRAKAIVSEAEQQARVTLQDAAEQGQRAQEEATTAIEVAINASNTTSASNNHRQSSTHTNAIAESNNQSGTTTHTTTVGFYDHYHSNA